MRLEVELPDGSQSLVLDPTQAQRRLSEILRSNNLSLNTRCGEKDMCAGCTIELLSGALEQVEDGTTVAGPAEVRGCRYRPTGDAVAIRVPQRSRLAYAPQVLDSYRINVPYARDPLVPTGLGAAIDIGTTTVAVQIFDLETGELVSKASGFNKQMHFGDDVLTRINLCSTDPKMLLQMQHAIVCETLLPLLNEAEPTSPIACYAVAGNTTMLHLLVGEDPSTLGVAPFRPSFLERQPFSAGLIGLSPYEAPVYLLPSIAAYIGADLTAGLFASGLLYDEGPSLLVDIGTNGEILLRHEGRTSGCATAAGPAFEGSGLTCGIRAGEGAISHVRFESVPFAVKVDKIGPSGMKPSGICGSAYVDFLAAGRSCGLLSETGRFQTVDESFMELSHGRAIRLAHGQGKRPITVSEADVARLLQAKAAIAAGILTLLDKHRLEPVDVKTLFLAGGFGMHLDLESAIGCGLLPGLTVPQIELVGNTSLAGARLALMDKNTLSELSRARHNVDVVELNLQPSFEDCYLDQLSLP